MTDVSTTASDTATAPLLHPRLGTAGGDSSAAGPSRQSVLGRLLGLATGRRGAPMLVRETAARELEERRADWGNWKPVVVLDVAWNVAFVVISVVMLICTYEERPNVPIRVWICVYALQCLVHATIVWSEYRRRNSRTPVPDMEAARRSVLGLEGNDSGDEDGSVAVFRMVNRSIFSKRCETVNTMVSFIWWIVGFYWVVSGGEVFLQAAPRLYWLAVVFLALDLFFAIFCVVVACLIGVALCCCLPCIIAILYVVAGQVGASDADVSVLPRYRFELSNDENKPSVGAGRMVPIQTSDGYLAHERILLPEDAECCICLSPYEDETELHGLPCNHHFHSTCVVKWLKINATCPLCKYNILKRTEHF